MTIIIETPKGSRDKFKYQPVEKKFIVNKTLPENMTFPFDFGFVPQTRGEDGDPLDILILSDEVHQTGAQLNTRIVGCLPARQTDQNGTIRNDRFIGVPANSESYAALKSIGQIPTETLDAIRSFFIGYLSVENKTIEFLPSLDGQQASQLLQLAKF